MVSVPLVVPRLMLLETVKPLQARRVAGAEPPVAPKVIALVEGPAAPVVVPTLLTLRRTVPELTNKPPVNVFAPPNVNCEVELFCVTVPTLPPREPEILTVPVPVPELTMLPLLLFEPESVMLPLSVMLPPVPDTVMVYDPVAVAAGTVNASDDVPEPVMEVGVKEYVTPVGSPLTERETAESKPSRTVEVTVELPLLPCTIETEVAERL